MSHLVIAAIAVGLIMLGLWQLDRYDQVTAANAEGRARMATDPVPLSEVLGAEPESVRYRRVVATGEYRPTDEVLIRSRVHPTGGAGFHVVTPLVLQDGSAILVDRGWVPLGMDTPPVAGAAPETGELTVTGWLEPGQKRPRFGPEDPPDGRLERMNRIDIQRIADQVDYQLHPVYLVAEGGGEGLPEPVEPPAFDDDGPHLAYALQWFAFAAVGLVGYFFLARKRAGQSRARPSTTS